MSEVEPRPQLVVLAGLPGTGKSTLAEHAARVLNCPSVSKDRLEAALRRSSASHNEARWAGYELLTTLAEEQLRLGQSVVLDSVGAFERVRQQWRQLAARYGTAFRVVECICSDRNLHKARMEGRQRNIPGWYELSWEEVEDIRSRYEPWDEERLVLDAVDSLESNVDRLTSFLGP